MAVEKNVNKNRMLSVLSNYKLKTPDAEVKTMPEGLRKEARIFIKTYIGDYSKEIDVIRSMKKEDFLSKHKRELVKEISNDEIIKDKIKAYNEIFDKMKSVYTECMSDERLKIPNSIYQFEKDSTEQYRLKVNESYVITELDKRFGLIYGKGFVEFKELLKKFEMKMEEAILFGTITDVYEILQKYSQFDEFAKKLSKLVIK